MATPKQTRGRTSKNKASKVVRVTVPAGDTITESFFEAQGPRGVSNAMRMLIHMFVAEYGTQTDVMSVVGQRLVAATSPADQAGIQTQKRASQQHAVTQENVDSGSETVSPPTDDVRDDEAVPAKSDLEPLDTDSQSRGVEPEPLSEPAHTTQETQPDPSPSPGLDMEDIFGKARNS